MGSDAKMSDFLRTPKPEGDIGPTSYDINQWFGISMRYVGETKNTPDDDIVKVCQWVLQANVDRYYADKGLPPLELNINTKFVKKEQTVDGLTSVNYQQVLIHMGREYRIVGASLHIMYYRNSKSVFCNLVPETAALDFPQKEYLDKYDGSIFVTRKEFGLPATFWLTFARVNEEGKIVDPENKPLKGQQSCSAYRGVPKLLPNASDCENEANREHGISTQNSQQAS